MLREKTDATVCEGCGGSFHWESIASPDKERWIGLCDCGAVRCFLPDDEQPVTSPLQVALLGERHPHITSPPWIRLYMSSLQLGVRWRPGQEPCGGCQARSVFETTRYPLPKAQAQIELCLGCGQVGIRTTRAGGRSSGSRVEGKRWTPTCIAVQHLRNCIYRDVFTEAARRQFASYQAFLADDDE
jgi:hypothetical protein